MDRLLPLQDVARLNGEIDRLRASVSSDAAPVGLSTPRPGMPVAPRPGDGSSGVTPRPGMPVAPRPGDGTPGVTPRPGMPVAPRPGDGTPGVTPRPGMPVAPRPGDGTPGVTPRPGMPVAPRPGDGSSGVTPRPGMPVAPRPGDGSSGVTPRPGMPVAPRPGGPGGAPRPGMPVAPRPGGPGGAPRPGGPGGAPRPGGPGGAAPEEPVGGLPKKPSKAPAKPVRSWFWVRVPDSKVEGTVWEFLSDERPVLDLAVLETTFAKGKRCESVCVKVGQGSVLPDGVLCTVPWARTVTRTGDARAAPESSAPASKKAQTISILDAKRQQNSGIVLGRLRLDRNVVHDAVRDSAIWSLPEPRHARVLCGGQWRGACGKSASSMSARDWTRLLFAVASC